VEVFDNKKTYQALKGCYERNFNLFKQIYAFEVFSAQSGNPTLVGLAEADRLRQYEQRLQAAKKAGCDVGNISARAIDTWHRIGWYGLFYSR
jgi:histone acetyltransferase MYST4